MSRSGTATRHIVRSLLASHVLRGSASALAIKFTGSVLSFAMFALAARHMDASGFGSLAVIFNAMSFLAVMATCGQETLIVRSWGEYRGSNRPALARGALTFGAKVVFGAASITAVVASLAWSIWDPGVSAALLLAGCAFLFVQALMHFSALFSRVAAGIVIAEAPREILLRLIIIATMLVYPLVGLDFTATEFFVAAAASLMVSLLLQIGLVARMLPEAVKRARPETDVAAWASRSFSMWVAAMLETTSQYAEVIAIGFFLGPAAAAYYFAATRITNVFAMIAASMTSYATTQISNLFHTEARGKLQGILRSLAIISAALAGGAFLVIVVAGKLLLWAFGAVYVAAYPAMVILALGASATAFTGPASYLLMLTGNERAYPRIMACALVVRFILIAALGSWFGLMGAAVAWSLSAVGMALALVIACRRLVRLDPSLFGAIRRNPPPLLKGSLP